MGDAFVDIVAGPLAFIPQWGGDSTCDSIKQHPGGSALNVSVGIGEVFGTKYGLCNVRRCTCWVSL